MGRAARAGAAARQGFGAGLGPKEWPGGLGRGLKSAAAEDGDDLGLHVIQGDGAEIAAVLGLGAIVAEDEYMTLGNAEGVGLALEGIGGIENLTTLGGAVDEEGAAVIKGDDIHGAGHDAADMAPALNGIDDHIILGVSVLKTIAKNQVAVFDGGEHAAAFRLGEKEDLRDQEPAAEGDEKDAQEQLEIIPAKEGL